MSQKQIEPEQAHRLKHHRKHVARKILVERLSRNLGWALVMIVLAILRDRSRRRRETEL